ncbi:MAG: O-methyltransferase [Candidatus Delongbacteria bacterium]|jgi:predicted O-methyltransferase YrrM|nr:O-methyltransferase [Candidatus Delongbacteria bacterium]
MILNEKLAKYLDELLKLDLDDTEDLYSYLVENKFPIVGRDTAKFLAQIVLIKQPEKILEIGTNVGFSALTMAKVLGKGMIYTVDYREDLQKQALENFKKFAVEDKIKIINGRAEKMLFRIEDKFDIIFIDADKRGYPLYLDYALEHINEGGIILVDNLFWKGSVYSPESFDPPKTAAPTLQEFNKRFSTLNGYKSQLLALGDGLGMAVKLN